MALVSIGLLLMTGCRGPEPADERVAGRGKAKAGRHISEKSGQRAPKSKKVPAGALTPMSGGPLTKPGSSGGGATDKSRIPPSRVGERFRFASARVEEPKPDAYKQGVPPAYAEILLVQITGLGDDVAFELTFDGNLPERMTDDSTYMMVGWSVTGREDEDGYGFGARATSEGWETYAGNKQEAQPFPGTFAIDGNQMTFTLPWRYLKGPRSFGWFATSAWVQNVGGVATYSSDPVPNGHLGRFPN